MKVHRNVTMTRFHTFGTTLITFLKVISFAVYIHAIVYTTAEVERRPKMSKKVKYAALKSQKVAHSEDMTSDSFSYLGLLVLVPSRAISFLMIFERRMFESSLCAKNMKLKGRIKAKVIWLKIFLHENTIL
ncbi:hypothetical protein ACFXTO_034154 [Malus domestica]